MDSFLIYLDGFVTFVPIEHELPTALKLLICNRFIAVSMSALYAFYVRLGIVAVGMGPMLYSDVVSRWFDKRRGLALGLMIVRVGHGSDDHAIGLQTNGTAGLGAKELGETATRFPLLYAPDIDCLNSEIAAQH